MPTFPGVCAISTASTRTGQTDAIVLAGHLFQGRFKAILVERNAYLLGLARYVVLNPVRARMVGAAGDWLWSSYRAMIGQAHAPAWLETYWLLAQFGSERLSAQAGYAAFVAQGVGQADVWQGLRIQVFLGSDAFVKRHCAPSQPSERLQEVPRAQRRAPAKPLDHFARRYLERHEAMALAYQSVEGVAGGTAVGVGDRGEVAAGVIAEQRALPGRVYGLDEAV